MSDSDTSVPFDLRFLPSWLKEDTSTPSYADYSGEESPRRERSDRRDGGARPGGQRPPGQRPPNQRDRPSGPRPGQGQGQRPDARGPRPGDGNRPPASRPPLGQPRPNIGQGRPGSQPPRGAGDRRDQPQRPREPQIHPAPVAVKFLPETIALDKVTEQLKSAPIAYPLFAVAKMFLQRPGAHLVQIDPLPETSLYRLAETSFFSTDRSWLEKIAFSELWKLYFRVDIVEGPEIKGNFTSVARSSLSGKIFGPTNHHQFQTQLHKEYEDRFSRRMSFAEYRSCIETTNDPAAIEQWKNDLRRVETYVLIPAGTELIATDAPTSEVSAEVIPDENHLDEETAPEIVDSSSEAANEESLPEISEPPAPPESEEIGEAVITEQSSETGEEAASAFSPIFASRAEAQTHFHQHILPTILLEIPSIVLSGQEARNLKDRHLATSIRLGWEAEARYPLGLVNQIRLKFNEQNLHIFKFKKRVLLISSLKPAWLSNTSESLSSSIRGLLQIVQAHPGINRKALAENVLADYATATDEEKLTRKQSLIGDLFWLIRQGHVIEFNDGTFDLPVGPKPPAEVIRENPKAAESTANIPAESSTGVVQEPDSDADASTPVDSTQPVNNESDKPI